MPRESPYPFVLSAEERAYLEKLSGKVHCPLRHTSQDDSSGGPRIGLRDNRTETGFAALDRLSNCGRDSTWNG